MANYIMTYANKETVDITVKCPFCGDFSTVADIPRKEWEAYENGELAQKSLVSLNAVDREILISGICKNCQETVFNGFF